MLPMELFLRLGYLVALVLICPTLMADVLIVSNTHHPMDALTTKDVRNIYLGRLHMYPGTNIEPHPIDLPQESPRFENFYTDVVELPPAKLKRYRAYYLFSGKGKIPHQASSYNNLIKILSEDPYAIGYVFAADPLNEKLKVLLRVESEFTNQLKE